MSDVRRFSATYASDRGWVIGRVPLTMGNAQFVLASDYDHLESENAQLRTERDQLLRECKGEIRYTCRTCRAVTTVSVTYESSGYPILCKRCGETIIAARQEAPRE